MRYLSSEEIKAEELKMLKAFDAFCRVRGLGYTLARGTLLGAVRHKGFIPWDDDIDVSMGRPCYDGFLAKRKEFEAESGYRVVPFRGTELGTAPYFKVVNPGVLVKADIEEATENLWIDVFPVDGLPANDDDLCRLYKRAARLRKEIIVAGVKPESGTTFAKRTAKRALKAVLSLPGVVERQSLRLDSLARAVPYGSTPYVGGVTWGLYGIGERVSLKGFEGRVCLSFEGQDFPCMSCWDEYLTGLYGDYMELPASEKRKSHDVVAWCVENGGA